MSRRQLLLCYLFLAVGLIAAAFSCWLRVSADAANRDVIILLDWHALNSLAEPSAEAALSAEDTAGAAWQLIADLPGAQLCYTEETVGTLLAQGIFRRTELITGAPAYEVTAAEYNADIAKGANRHGYWYERSAATAGKLVVQLPDLPEEELTLLPVAWLQEVRDAGSGHGVSMVLRPGGSEYLGEDGIRRTLDYCANQSVLLFAGPTVLGYPHELKTVATGLTAQGQSFGWIEFDEQDGGASLAALLSPRVVRVHSIPPEEMVNYDAGQAVARYLRAARERGIRALYVRPFVRGTAAGGAAGYRQNLISANQRYFRELAAELKAAGFTIANQVEPPAGPPSWLVRLRPFTTTLAVGAAAVILFALWLPAWPRWVWTLLLAITVLKGALATYVGIVDSAVHFAASLFFPLLAFWLATALYQRWVREHSAAHPLRLFAALVALIVACLVTAAGGMLIHGGLWDAHTMLKVGQFRGVTLALAVPVLVLAAYAWQGETLQGAYDAARRQLADYWQRFIGLWQAPIRYGDVAFILIAVGALAVVLLRSGNESPLEILNVEAWFRSSLEDWFALRPRTKELFGHPLFIVFMLSLPWRSRISLLFALAALLGQVSILNTFCHLHTPLLVTVERVTLGLGLGLASGIGWGIIVLVLTWLWHRLRMRRVQLMT